MRGACHGDHELDAVGLVVGGQMGSGVIKVRREGWTRRKWENGGQGFERGTMSRTQSTRYTSVKVLSRHDQRFDN